MIYYSSTKNIEIKERNLAIMNTTLIEDQNQTLVSEELGIFSAYFAKLKVGSLLNRSGIVKLFLFPGITSVAGLLFYLQTLIFLVKRLSDCTENAGT